MFLSLFHISNYIILCNKCQLGGFGYTRCFSYPICLVQILSMINYVAICRCHFDLNK